MTEHEKPNCHKCVHRRDIPGDAHSRCNNFQAHVIGNEHGIHRGWFMWPVNFDPTWLLACDGFSDDPKDDKQEQRMMPLAEVIGLLAKRFYR